MTKGLPTIEEQQAKQLELLEICEGFAKKDLAKEIQNGPTDQKKAPFYQEDHKSSDIERELVLHK